VIEAAAAAQVLITTGGLFLLGLLAAPPAISGQSGTVDIKRYGSSTGLGIDIENALWSLRQGNGGMPFSRCCGSIRVRYLGFAALPRFADRVTGRLLCGRSALQQL
jgi:hypothetical protein